MGTKIKTQKNPRGYQQNPKKSLVRKLTPKKSHAEFPNLKSLQKALNYIHRCSLFGYTLFAELRGVDTQALPGIFTLF